LANAKVSHPYCNSIKDHEFRESRTAAEAPKHRS
jgi:hypothetical protein